MISSALGCIGGSGEAGVLMIMPMTPMITSALRTSRDVFKSCDAIASFEFISSRKHPNQNGIYHSGKLFGFAPPDVQNIKATGTASNVNLGGCGICGKPRTRPTGSDALAGSGPKFENARPRAGMGWLQSFSEDESIYKIETKQM